MSAAHDEPVWKYVKASDVLKLPHVHRVAWLAAIIERIASLYPETFRRKYHLDAAIEFAWKFVVAKSTNSNEYDDLIAKLDKASERAEGDGYAGQSILPAFYLVVEVLKQQGSDAAAAVNFLGTLYAQWAISKQGMTLDSVDDDIFGGLEESCMDFSYRAFRSALEKTSMTPTRQWLDSIEFDTSYSAHPPRS